MIMQTFLNSHCLGQPSFLLCSVRLIEHGMREVEEPSCHDYSLAIRLTSWDSLATWPLVSRSPYCAAGTVSSSRLQITLMSGCKRWSSACVGRYGANKQWVANDIHDESLWNCVVWLQLAGYVWMWQVCDVVAVTNWSFQLLQSSGFFLTSMSTLFVLLDVSPDFDR